MTTENKIWCPHISKLADGGGWVFQAAPIFFGDKSNFKFCPVCGAKRPEEPKALWRSISVVCYQYENELPHQMSSEKLMKRVSLSAIKWFNENLPRVLHEERAHSYRIGLTDLLENEKEKCK